MEKYIKEVFTPEGVTVDVYDEQRLRQLFLQEQHYEIMIINTNRQNGYNKEFIDEGKDYRTMSWYLHHMLYYRLMLKYTVGGDINQLEPLLEGMAATMHDVLSLMQEARRPEDKYYLGDLFYNRYAMNDITYNTLGLCVLFNRLDIALLINEVADGADFPLFDLLISFLEPSFPVTENEIMRPHTFRRSLVKAIQAKTEKETLRHLNHYLINWYEGMRKIEWLMYDSHLRPETEPGTYGYYGYWSFDAAAVAFAKGVDDSSLHQYLHYPKDMVAYARNRFPQGLSPTTEISVDPVWGGNPATMTGVWYCPNMLQSDPRRLQNVTQGQELLKGESAKGVFVWHFMPNTKV